MTKYKKNYKSLPPEIWTELSKALEKTLKENSRAVAAFDADGTLWDTDLGENFFKWQIKNCQLTGMPPDPWMHYRDLKAAGDPRPAYLWLAQINKGQSLKQVRIWAQEAIKPVDQLPIFEEQRKIIEWLQKNQVQVYIISASIKWAVEPGAKLFGIPEENVLGVATQIDSNGIVTEKQDGVITYQEGKPEALKIKTGQFPFFASGNTMGDFALLSAATELRLAVGATAEGHELFKTEEELRQNARKNNWRTHSF